jgi:putative phosphoesterase
MKLAILSDIHGNICALEKVYSKCKSLGLDEIIFLGDLCTLGPNPKETCDFLLEKNIKSVLGNHDEYMFHEEAIYSYTSEPIIIDSILWAKNELSSSTLDSIQKFSYTISINYSSTKSILFYHGSPKCNTDLILSETSNETITEYFQEFSETILIGGHTHIQMQKRFKDKTLVNPGSVGQPFLANSMNSSPPVLLPWAEFCTISLEKEHFSVEFYQMEYDLKRYIQLIKDSNLPLKNWLALQYKGIF